MRQCGASIPSSARAADVVRAWLSWSIWALLPAVAIVVVWRRAAGALAMPLNPIALVLAAILMALAATVARPAVRRASLSHRVLAANVVCSLAIVLLGLGLSVPGTSVLGLVVFWAVMICEELWAWQPLLLPHLATELATPSPQPLTPGPAPDILQQLTLTQSPDGTQRLAGLLRMPLAAGQRTGSLHVAFCPPFPRTPEVEVEQTDGPEARVRVAQVLPHGARIDVKLAQACDEVSDVLLEFCAVAAPGPEIG